MGMIVNLFFLALLLCLAYWVITLAVRHGIDNSDVGKMLKKKYDYEAEKFHTKDDLDKD